MFFEGALKNSENFGRQKSFVSEISVPEEEEDRSSISGLSANKTPSENKNLKRRSYIDNSFKVNLIT